MTELPVRRAVVTDVPALVELRALMFEAMNVSGVESQHWRIQAADWFTKAMAQEDICILVIEGDKSQVSACAMGQVREVAPSPGNPSGLCGLVSNVVSAPSVRGRGYASGCLAGLMGWFKDETSVETVELFATGHGRNIYERAGFGEHHFPAMRIRLAR